MLRLMQREQRGVPRSQLCLDLAQAEQERRRVWRMLGDGFEIRTMRSTERGIRRKFRATQSSLGEWGLFPS